MVGHELAQILVDYVLDDPVQVVVVHRLVVYLLVVQTMDIRVLDDLVRALVDHVLVVHEVLPSKKLVPLDLSEKKEKKWF